MAGRPTHPGFGFQGHISKFVLVTILLVFSFALSSKQYDCSETGFRAYLHNYPFKYGSDQETYVEYSLIVIVIDYYL